MATVDFRIGDYWVFLGSKLLVNSALGRQEAIPAQAMIQCAGPSASLTIFFLDADRSAATNADDSDQWPNRCEISGNRARGEMFAPVSHYSMYLDILRNEDPVFAHLDSTQPLRMRISCNEPVGETE